MELMSTSVALDTPLCFRLSLVNDLNEEVGRLSARDVDVRAEDESGELPMELISARPEKLQGTLFERASVGVARLFVRGEGKRLSDVLPVASLPFVVVDGDSAHVDPSPAPVAFVPREVDVGGRVGKLILLESSEAIHFRLWDAGLALAQYAAHSSPESWLPAEQVMPRPGSSSLPLTGLRILELGSGTGVTALAFAALGAQVTATDSEDDCVQLIAKNALANGLEGHVLPEVVRWGEDSPALHRKYDVVIFADCVYLEKAFVPLIATLKASAQAGTRNLLVAYRRRCEPDVEAHFFHLLEECFELRFGSLAYGTQLIVGTSRPCTPGRGPADCQYCEFLRVSYARSWVQRWHELQGPQTAAGSARSAAAWNPSGMGMLGV